MPTRKPAKMRQPDEFLFEVGQAWVSPTSRGECLNPYMPEAHLRSQVLDGWGAFLIMGTGRAFDWLAWYLVSPISNYGDGKPNVEMIRRGALSVCRPGTMTKSHAKKMKLELLGKLELDVAKLPDGASHPATIQAAINDISICNNLSRLAWSESPNGYVAEILLNPN
jgi:hypothetical protein